jgi:hypothetical protein
MLHRSLELMESGDMHIPDEIRAHGTPDGSASGGAWRSGGLGGIFEAGLAGLGSRAGVVAGASAWVQAVWELAQLYKEYLSWPRDVDTGARAGFPGRDMWAPPGARQIFDRGEDYVHLPREIKR